LAIGGTDFRPRIRFLTGTPKTGSLNSVKCDRREHAFADTEEADMNYLIGALIALALLIGSAFAQGDIRNSADNSPAGLQGILGSGAVQNISYPVSEPAPPPRVNRVADPYEHLQFVINDWQQHNLRAPPRGYHWISNDRNQYLLVSINNGIVVEIRDQIDQHSQRQWLRGQQLPPDYLTDRYLVTDWRGYHLRKPGRGTHWVRVDNNFMLATDATGVIAEIAFNSR
jgi:Ni/Co efflux regulator RcnB